MFDWSKFKAYFPSSCYTLTSTYTVQTSLTDPTATSNLDFSYPACDFWGRCASSFSPSPIRFTQEDFCCGTDGKTCDTSKSNKLGGCMSGSDCVSKVLYAAATG